jgi:integrase
MRRAPGTGSVYRPGYRTPQGEKRQARLYWIAYRVAGQLRREPAKTTSRQDAERLLRARLATLDRGEVPATSRTRWDDLADMIRADYKANDRKSAARLGVSLKHLDAAFAGQRAEGITPERLTAYAALRREEGAARASINRELAALKRAFRLAHRAGRVAAVPYVAMLEERNTRTGFFERLELDRVLRALPADVRPAVLAAYVTGWRMTSELLTREWRHVDLKRGWLRLEPGETKNRQGRLFPLIPELRASLRAQRRVTTVLERRLGRVVPLVFHHGGEALYYRGKAGLLPSAYLREAWAAACAKARLPLDRIRHDFRRTAARDMLRAGNPVPVVMKAMGWESEAMLRRYTVVEEQDLVAAGKRRAKLR